jgi:hypothetical protein
LAAETGSLVTASSSAESATNRSRMCGHDGPSPWPGEPARTSRTTAFHAFGLNQSPKVYHARGAAGSAASPVGSGGSNDRLFAFVGDPVGAGLVASLARPGGNLTGFSIMSTELTSKRLELLAEVVPQGRVIALLVDPEAAKGVRAGGIHGGRCRRSCRRMKRCDLDKYQTRRESCDERQHGGCYRDSERQHPCSSAHPLQPGSKKRSRRNSEAAFAGRPSVGSLKK